MMNCSSPVLKAARLCTQAVPIGFFSVVRCVLREVCDYYLLGQQPGGTERAGGTRRGGASWGTASFSCVEWGDQSCYPLLDSMYGRYTFVIRAASFLTPQYVLRDTPLDEVLQGLETLPASPSVFVWIDFLVLPEQYALNEQADVSAVRAAILQSKNGEFVSLLFRLDLFSSACDPNCTK